MGQSVEDSEPSSSDAIPNCLEDWKSSERFAPWRSCVTGNGYWEAISRSEKELVSPRSTGTCSQVVATVQVITSK